MEEGLHPPELHYKLPIHRCLTKEYIFSIPLFLRFINFFNFYARCIYYGSEENKGFCSTCVKSKDNFPSEETLRIWNESRQDPEHKASSIERTYKKEKEKEKEVKNSKTYYNYNNLDWQAKVKHFHLVQRLVRFLSTQHALYSIKIIETQGGGGKWTYPQGRITFPLALPLFQQRFSKTIKCLSLPYVQLNDEFVSTIAREFINLEHIDLTQPFHTCRPNTKHFINLCQLPHLESVNLTSCIIETHRFIRELPEMPNLRSLVLARNSLMCNSNEELDKTIDNLVSKVPNLVLLDLQDCVELHTFTMLPLVKFTKLRILNLMHEHHASIHEWSWAMKIPQLRYLFVSRERVIVSAINIVNPELQVYLAETNIYVNLPAYFLPCYYCNLNYLMPKFPFQIHPRQGQKPAPAREEDGRKEGRRRG